jgi:hypothetical protein
MDSSIICPECGCEIAPTDTICRKCGFPLKDVDRYHDETHKNPVEIVVGMAMVLVGIFLMYNAYKTRFQGDYDYIVKLIKEHESHIEEYQDLKQEMLNEANSYSPGFFRNSYKELANTYQRLIDNANEKIEEYKEEQNDIIKRSIGLLILAIACVLSGGFMMTHNLEVVNNTKQNKK